MMTAKPKVEFGELPRITHHDGRRREYLDVADTLRARPGKWAKVTPRGKPQFFVNAVRAGLLVAFPAGEFEAALRDGEAWVRYIGPPS
jgi:hypothetical protein